MAVSMPVSMKVMLHSLMSLLEQFDVFAALGQDEVVECVSW